MTNALIKLPAFSMNIFRQCDNYYIYIYIYRLTLFCEVSLHSNAH